jgi:hypothetical protein
MRVLQCVFWLYAHGDCCEAMHVCACLCVLLHKVIAARRCMHVWECVFGLAQGMVTVIAAR